MLDLRAYVDPGTASLIIQIVAGVLIVCGVVLKIWWTKISSFFKSVWAKLTGKKKSDQAENLDDAASEVSDAEKDAEETTVAEEVKVAEEDSENP